MWPISPRPERTKCTSKKCVGPSGHAHLPPPYDKCLRSASLHCSLLSLSKDALDFSVDLDTQPTWAVYFPKAMSKLFAVACAVRHWLTYHVGHTHRGLPAHGSSSELTFEWGRDTHTIWFLFTTVCTRHRLNQRNQVEKWVSGGSGCEDTLPRGSHRHRELDLRII